MSRGSAAPRFLLCPFFGNSIKSVAEPREGFGVKPPLVVQPTFFIALQINNIVVVVALIYSYAYKIHYLIKLNNRLRPFLAKNVEVPPPYSGILATPLAISLLTTSAGLGETPYIVVENF